MPETLPLTVLLTGAALTAEGCRRVLAAGSAEARGDLPGARRGSRSGGMLAAAASPLWATASGLLAPRGPTPGWLAASAGLALAAGFLALLAGLSGKPRPTGWFAAAAWGTAAGLLAVSLTR